MKNITKNALADSFKKIASNKKISDISISEITENCGLKRQTFYNYFKDKYDIIKWIYKNEVILKIENDNDWDEKYEEVFKYFIKNKNMVLNIYNCEAQNYLIHFILKQSKPIIKNVIEEKSEKYDISTIDKEFLCSFYSGALGALIINWIEIGMPNIYDDLITRVKVLLNGNIENYINMTNNDKCQKI